MTNRIFYLLTFLFIAVTFSSCTWVKPEEEGVLMTNYGRNGIEDFQQVTGKVQTWQWGRELIKIPMYEQKGDIERFKIYSKNAGEFVVDPSYSYTAIRGKGKEIAFNHKNYVENDLQFLDAIEQNILNERIFDVYKETAREYTTDSLMNNMQAFEKAVEVRVSELFKKKHFSLIRLSSGLELPQSLKDAVEKRDAAVEEANQVANQLEIEKRQNEIKLETARAELEVARINAEKNRVLSESLTPAVIEMKKLELQEKAINGWIESGCKTPNAVGNFIPYDIMMKK